MAPGVLKGGTVVKGRLRFTIFTLLALTALMLFASVSSASAATLTSDKSDYFPGETVTLTGAGWQAGESVQHR